LNIISCKFGGQEKNMTMKHNNFLFRATFFTGLIILFFASLAFAQPGGLDTKFSTGAGFAFQTSKNSAVYAMAVQTDGKIVVGGQFVSFNGTPCNYIARLNADGTLDNSFNTGSGFNNPVRTLSIQTDGKIIAGGQFTSFDGKEQNHIVRLNSDGSKDESFNVGSSFNDVVYATVIQPDGKIIAGGKFTNFNGTWQNYIVRLNPDGAIDLVFYPEKGFNDIVFALALQNDGKVLAGGIFTAFNGSPANRIIRLSADGKADASFLPGSGFDNDVRVISIDNDNKVVAGGYFTTYNGKTIGYLARINSNGSLDETFKSGTGFNGSVQALAVQSDNRIIAGGFYTSYNGTERKNITRINADGTVDASFTPGKGSNSGVMALHIGNTVLLGGGFTTYNDAAANQVCRIISDPYIVSVSPTTGVCAGGNLAIEFSSEGVFAEGNVFTIQLSDAIGNFSNAVNIGSLTAVSGSSITATIPASTPTGLRYRVRLTASNPPVKSKPYETDIKINALVTPSLTIAATPADPVCAGNEIKFKSTIVNGGVSPSYQWKVNGNNVDESSSSYSSSNLKNGDAVTCVLTSNAQCLSQNNVTSNSVSVKINPLLTPSITISASPAEKICEQTEVKFIASVVNGGASPVFQWKKNGVVTGVNSVSYSEFSLKNGDEIICTVTSNAECLSVKQASSNAIVMKVNPIVTPAVTIASDAGEVICSGKEVVITASVENSGIDPLYQWKKNGKNVGTNSVRYTDAALKNGDEISCVIVSDNQCVTKKEATSNYLEFSVKECNQ
jgi:uncharacterized delta-60 repeat protein